MPTEPTTKHTTFGTDSEPVGGGASLLIASRHHTHGRFEDTAKIAQNLKACCQGLSHRLPAHQREALDLICTKMARILNGDNNCPDHWDDIGGYADLGKEPNR